MKPSLTSEGNTGIMPDVQECVNFHHGSDNEISRKCSAAISRSIARYPNISRAKEIINPNLDKWRDHGLLHL